jgi:hypothetical protein
LIDLNLEPNLVKTDRLFFDQYRYCVRIIVPDISCIREIKNKNLLDSDQAGQAVYRAFEKRRESRLKWGLVKLHSDTDKKIRQQRVDRVLSIADFLYPHRFEIKMMFSGNWGTFYTNSWDFVCEIVSKNFSLDVELKEAVIDRPRDTVRLESSQFNYRSYFAEISITTDAKQNLKQYLISQPDIRIGPGLMTWLNEQRHYNRWRQNSTQRYFFIDHNNAGFPVMLSLIIPSLVRKTISIIKVNN